MNIIKLLSLVCALASLNSACQSASPEQVEKEMKKFGGGSTEKKIDVNSASIAGAWKSLCERDSERSELFSRNKLDITSSFFYLTTEYFADAKCEFQSYMLEKDGYFTLENTRINVNYSSISFTPQSGIILTVFNSGAGLCGYNKWLLNDRRSYSDLTSCGYESSFQSQIELKGANELHLGDLRFIR